MSNRPKFVILIKIFNSKQNLSFRLKCVILTKIFHFDQYLSVRSEFVITTQICQFDPNLSFGQNFVILTKICSFDKKCHLDQNFDIYIAMITPPLNIDKNLSFWVKKFRFCTIFEKNLKLQYVLMISNDLKNSFLGSIFEFYE